MEMTLMIIFACLVALMGVVVLFLSIDLYNFKKDTYRRLIQLELDYEHLRKQFLEARCNLSKGVLLLFKELDELTAQIKSKAKAKNDTADKFGDIVKTIADKYPDAEINVIDLDRFKSDKFKDIYAQSLKSKVKTKKVEVKDTNDTDKGGTPAQKDADKKRILFAEYREKLGMSVREAAKKLGVSPTTAKRYEKWRTNRKE